MTGRGRRRSRCPFASRRVNATYDEFIDEISRSVRNDERFSRKKGCVMWRRNRHITLLLFLNFIIYA